MLWKVMIPNFFPKKSNLFPENVGNFILILNFWLAITVSKLPVPYLPTHLTLNSLLTYNHNMCPNSRMEFISKKLAQENFVQVAL